ncbi:MAG: TIR domain-containing protein [Pseudonocardiales bacterium]
MRLFVSYSSKDSTSAKPLIRDLEAARHAVWVDQELTGGDSWWREILQQIRQCDVFVLALSNNSLRSKPCMAELDYAEALGLPVVPVQIGPVDRPRLSPIAHIQIIDYRDPTAAMAIALVAALQDGAARRGELPDPLPEPLPEPPPIPYEYLMRLSAQIDSTVLQHADQLAIVAQLRDSLEIEEDNDIRVDLGELLRRLRSRPDVTFRVASEVDALLHQYDNAAAENSTTASKRATPAPHPPGAPTGRPGVASHQMPPTAGRAQQPARHEPSPSRVPPITSLPAPPTNRWRAITALALGILSVITQFSFIGSLAIIGLLTGIIGIVFAIVAKLRKEPLANEALMISIGGTGLFILRIIG